MLAARIAARRNQGNKEIFMATRTHAKYTSKHNHAASTIGGVIDGAEALVEATANLGEDKLVGIRKSLQQDLEAAREHLEKLEAGIKNQATNVDDYVHENPWQSIGVAAGAGVVTGVLVGALAFRR
jgi:ElaB/YqjD/DUF883 family membrane-anchored ribosome-binding protein